MLQFYHFYNWSDLKFHYFHVREIWYGLLLLAFFLAFLSNLWYLSWWRLPDSGFSKTLVAAFPSNDPRDRTRISVLAFQHGKTTLNVEGITNNDDYPNYICSCCTFLVLRWQFGSCSSAILTPFHSGLLSSPVSYHYCMEYLIPWIFIFNYTG